MATAAIPAMFERSPRPQWTPASGMRREAVPSAGSAAAARGVPEGLENVGTPGEPSHAEKSKVPMPPPDATPERTAALAEQKVLAEMAARCQAGDPAAWEQLARTQHRRVYGICYRFTGSQSDAEDLTQEVFLKMYRSISNFDPARGGFTTWLATLTRNLLVDNYRRSRLERASDSLDEPFGGEEDGPSKAERLADERPGQEKHVAGVELRAQIQEALKKVSPELREAVILRDLEDMDYKEIAEVLGVPQGTVKSRISRGRAELARLLKSLEGQVM